MSRTFMDRPITKETIALGVAGQIERGDGFPELPPVARVTFQAEADFRTVKHKFLAKGGVEEALILTIVSDSFEVLSVEEQPEQASMLDDDEEEGDGSGG